MKLTQKKIKCTPLGRRFLGIAMMHVPKLALESAERFIVLDLCWFLADLGFLSMLPNIPNISPSANTLKDIGQRSNRHDCNRARGYERCSVRTDVRQGRR